jgi:hypothetical protein
MTQPPTGEIVIARREMGDLTNRQFKKKGES